MATPIPDGMYRAKLRWRLEGDPEEIISTIGLRNNEPGERDLNEVAEAVFNAWVGAFPFDGMTTEYSFVGVDVDQGTGGVETIQGTYNEVVAGAGGGSALPQNCAILLKKKTASSGRRNSGRMFLPPAYIGEAGATATGVISGSDVATLTTWANQWYANLTDSTSLPPGSPGTSFTPVILHSTPEGGGAVLVATDITSFVIDPILATQRRRMRP